MAGRLIAGAASGVGEDPQAAVEAALLQLDADLGAAAAALVVLFLGADYLAAADHVVATVADRHPDAVLLGCSAGGVLAGTVELERPDAVALLALAAPGLDLDAVPLRYPAPSDDGAVTWPAPPDDAAAVILLADPRSSPVEQLVGWLDQGLVGAPVVGGLASGGPWLLVDGNRHDDGAVAAALVGDVEAVALVSQGCRPVGDPYVVTGVRGQVITSLGGQPPTERLSQAFQAADEDDRQLMRRGLSIGTVLDERVVEPGPGDFLIRAVLGAASDSGSIAIGDRVPLGRTVQFQVRDAAGVDAELEALLDRVARLVDAALLFTCNGRGQRLFGEPHHDAELVSARLRAPLAGFFAAGEIGPVAGVPHLHGFTASLLALRARRR